VNAHFILTLGNTFEARCADDWWDDFAKMNRHEFEDAARDLVGPKGRLASCGSSWWRWACPSALFWSLAPRAVTS
jgi:hypothetical protein